MQIKETPDVETDVGNPSSLATGKLMKNSAQFSLVVIKTDLVRYVLMIDGGRLRICVLALCGLGHRKGTMA